MNGRDEYVKSLTPYTLEYAEEKTGIDQETLIQMAEMIGQADSVCALWAMG